MEPIESYFKSHDHHRLYYQTWRAKNPKAVLIFVHGLNEHSGRYQNPIQYFFKRDYTLYLFDHRGHGKSDGLRSFVDSFDAYLKDAHVFTTLVFKEEKGLPIFMVGHSMGGQIVLNYVAQYNPALAGFITSSANIQTRLKISWLKKRIGNLATRYYPQLAVTNEIDPKWISRDPEVVRAYKRDTLVSKKITLKLAFELFKNQDQIMTLPQKITIPALMLHAGDDHICAVEGTKQFYNELKSQDKEIKIYEGCYHELFNEFCKEEVFGDMEKWMEKHL